MDKTNKKYPYYSIPTLTWYHKYLKFYVRGNLHQFTSIYNLKSSLHLLIYILYWNRLLLQEKEIITVRKTSGVSIPKSLQMSLLNQLKNLGSLLIPNQFQFH